MKRIIFIIILIFIIVSVYQISDENIIIPNSSIRLRVIPNSNDTKDIYIKEQVKDYLEENIYTLLKDTSSIDDARIIINDNLPNIKDNIKQIFLSNNYNLDYQVNYGYNYFPEKVYKGITYKEGNYESIVISIGEANGDNWWCVLFPNFCLIDTNQDHEYRLYIKELINKYHKIK